MTFEPPNYTQTPNLFFALAPDMGGAELQVTIQVIRSTFGWQAGGSVARMSLTELMTATKLSKQGCLNGIQQGCGRGTLLIAKVGRVMHLGLNFSGAVPPMPRPYLLTPEEVAELGGVWSEGGETRSTSWTGRSTALTDKSTALTDEKDVRSTALTEQVHEVDREGPRSRPIKSPEDRAGQDFSTPKERKEKERKLASRQTENETQNGNGQPPASGPALRTGSGSDSGTPQIKAASLETVPPEPPEKVKGRALAALTACLSNLGRPVSELIAEYTYRAAWLELSVDRIRELTAAAQLAHGNRYRGALIAALDDEARYLLQERQHKAAAGKVSAPNGKPAAAQSATASVLDRIYGSKA